MIKKNVIFIIGSNASGKTTVAKMLHDKLGDSKKQIIKGEIDGVEYCYTSFGSVCHVGAVNDNQCTGTDTLSKKIQVETSYIMALNDEHSQIIILDPIMSTGKYVDFLKQFDVNLMLIYLHFNTPEENFIRVLNRRYEKNGSKEPLDDKTKENLTGKQRGFYSLFNRTKDIVDCWMKIDAVKDRKYIENSVIEFISNNL